MVASAQFFAFFFTMWSYIVALAVLLAVAYAQTYMTVSTYSGTVCSGSPFIEAFTMDLCYADSSVANQWGMKTYTTGTGTAAVTTTLYSNSACTIVVYTSVITYSTTCSPSGSQSILASFSYVLTTSWTGYVSSM